MTTESHTSFLGNRLTRAAVAFAGGALALTLAGCEGNTSAAPADGPTATPIAQASTRPSDSLERAPAFDAFCHDQPGELDRVGFIETDGVTGKTRVECLPA